MQFLDDYNLPETLVSLIANPIEKQIERASLLNQLQQKFIFHERGKYWWREVSTKDDSIEEVIILWPPGSDSGIHDHGHSWNVTYAIGNNPHSVLNTYLYQEYKGQKIICEQQLDFKQYHLVPPYQQHRVSNQGTETIIGRHLYYPRRSRTQN